jgi:hypothetical protein
MIVEFHYTGILVNLENFDFAMSFALGQNVGFLLRRLARPCRHLNFEQYLTPTKNRRQTLKQNFWWRVLLDQVFRLWRGWGRLETENVASNDGAGIGITRIGGRCICVNT